MKYFGMTIWQIFMFYELITHLVCWFLMGNTPERQLELSKKLSRKMEESKVLEEILDKLFMGE